MGILCQRLQSEGCLLKLLLLSHQKLRKMAETVETTTPTVEEVQTPEVATNGEAEAAPAETAPEVTNGATEEPSSNGSTEEATNGTTEAESTNGSTEAESTESSNGTTELQRLPPKN